MIDRVTEWEQFSNNKVAIGARVGLLTIIKEIEPYISRSGKTKIKQYECVCDCGNKTRALYNHLLVARRTSCGCRHTINHNWSPGNKTHGRSRTKEYLAWQGMLNRCRNNKHKDFKYYGGRGISVCQRWTDSFELFCLDMGDRPIGKTIDRVDPSGNYEPSNCRWATVTEQNNNKRMSIK